MARIRIYQSFFNSPPLQRPDVLGVQLENKADVRQRLPQLDGVVNASGLSYVFPLSRTQVLGAPLESKADVRPRLSRLDGAIIAAGSNGPELWNPPVTVVTVATSGWDFQQPPLAIRRRSADPESDDALSDVLGSVAAPPQSGWSIALPTLPPSYVRRKTLRQQRISIGTSPEAATPLDTSLGWVPTLPDLPQFKRKQALPELAARLDQPAEAPPTGWSIVLPDLPTRRKVPSLAIVDSLSLPLGLETPPQGWNVSLAELKQVKTRIGFADAAIDAESWSPLETVAAQPWGWSLPPPRVRAVPESVFAGPTLDWTTQQVSVGWSVELPELSAPRHLLAATPDQSDLYNPPVEVTQPDTGWTINLPELAPRKRLPQGEFTTRSDRPDEAAATGWNVVLPDLPQFRRKQALPDQPSGLERPGSLPAAVNWTVEPPITLRRPTVLAGALAGATLASQAITQAAQTGWNVVVPDLPQFRRKQAVPELAARIDQPAELTTRGWSIVQPDLPQFRRKQALPETTSRIDQPSGLDSARSLGWIAELPHLTRGTFRGGILAGAVLAPQDITQPAQTGWDIVVPDLPAFRRKQALPELAGRLDQPTDLVTGWSVVEPDLPQFRRKQALPESTGRIDQPSAIASAVSLGWVIEPPHLTRGTYRGGTLAGGVLTPQDITPTAQTGWNVVVPDLPQFKRKQALPETAAGRLDQPQAQPYGASVVLPDLPQFRRKQALPESAGRLDQASAIQTQSLGWVCELPLFARVDTYRGGALAGASLAPQTVTPTAATGWNVVLPDLPAFRRKQVRVENINRLDQPAAITGTVFEEGWSVVLPNLPQFKRKQALPELAGRIDKPTAAFQWGWSVVLPDVVARPRRLPVEPQGRLDQPQGQPYGWNVVTPDLPQARTRPALTEIAGRIDQPADQPYGWSVTLPDIRRPLRNTLPDAPGRLDQPQDQPYGWSVVTPDLPQARRHPALTEIAWRIDTPVVVVVVQATSGWAVDPPALRRTRPISGGIFAGATHDPPQIEPSTAPSVTPRQQTYFVANLGRFMRRG